MCRLDLLSQQHAVQMMSLDDTTELTYTPPCQAGSIAHAVVVMESDLLAGLFVD